MIERVARMLALGIVAFSLDVAVWIVTSDIGMPDEGRMALVLAGNVVLAIGMLKGKPLNG